MHTIDLLRGQGIPAKTTLAGIIILVVAAVVPFVIAIGMLDRYLQNRTVISVQQQAIANEQAKIDELSDAVKLQESLQKKKNLINSRLSEVSSCIDQYVQWSPILETLAKNMPWNMILTSLSTELTHLTKSAPRKDDSKKTDNISVPKRTLILNISSTRPGSYGNVVQEFKYNLESSASLAQKLENITQSQELGKSGDEKIVSYTLVCNFKTGL